MMGVGNKTRRATTYEVPPKQYSDALTDILMVMQFVIGIATPT
jgi:hypothetical protein